ncbi:MAG TPA: hypothetical protein VJL84_06900 [Kiloniellales bacterium]|nr:hypothetical protein [Kiloniellales bacterium]
MSLKAIAEISPLRFQEIPAMVALEEAAWSEPLRASENTIRRRLELGHVMMVARAKDGRLAASVCFTPTAEEPFDRDSFPANFAQFSSLPRSEPVRSIYVYNLCVDPDFRSLDTVRSVMIATLASARDSGARWIVGDGRCAAYRGSLPGAPDKVKADAKFRAAIESWRRSGRQPPDAELTRDPLLRFHYRQLKCRFLHLMPDFLPEDVSSAGYRVIFVADAAELGFTQ